METNPYEYDGSVSWIPQQNQAYNGQNNGQDGQQRPPVRQMQRGAGTAQKPGRSKPMPKARTLELAHSLKQWLVVASVVGFGTLSGLAAFHRVGTATATGSSNSTGQMSQTTSSSSSSNGFLQQRGEHDEHGEHNDGSDDSDSASNSSNSTSTNSSSSSTSTNSSSSSTSTGSSTSTSSASSSSQPVSGTRTS